MRGVSGLAVLAGLAASVALLTGRAPAQPGVIAAAVSSDPSFAIANSRDGTAILTVPNLAPGHSAGGSVTVANEGTLPGTFAVSQLDLADAPGPGGGPISTRLELSVSDVTAPTPVSVYSGPMAGFASRELGYFAPGQARTFRFTVALPNGEALVDNLFAGSAATVGYRWTGTSLPAGTPPPAAPVPPPPPGEEEPALTAPEAPAARPAAPAGGDPGEGRARPPLRLALRVPRHQPLLARGALIAYARCDEPCRVSVWSWVEDPLGPARFLRGHLRMVLEPGRRTRLRLRLPGAPRNLLGRALQSTGTGVVHVRADAAAVDGRRVTATRDFELGGARAGALP